MDNNLIFKEVTTLQDCAFVSKLAYEIWTEHYINIISDEQIEYMIDRYQSESAIFNEVKYDNYRYALVYLENEKNPVAYCAIQIKEDKTLFLSKIYVKKANRGRGIATKMLLHMLEPFKENNRKAWLTVNKDNKDSVETYKKMGFSISDSVISDIGNGFFMDDFIMEIEISDLF